MAAILLLTKSYGKAFIASATAQLGIISTAGISIFPFILPSSSHPDSSLTVWCASSSHMTLFLMLVAVIIFLPLILIQQFPLKKNDKENCGFHGIQNINFLGILGLKPL